MKIFSEHSVSGTPINAEKSFMYLGFDVVSDLTFGKSWNMLATGKPHPIIKEFIEGKKFVGFLIIQLWIYHLVKALPFVNRRIVEWLECYSRELDERSKVV
jgi:cytochrome P450 family 628